MEDGPGAKGGYEYGGKTYRLEERESEVWSVLDGDRVLGELAATTGPERGPFYTVKLAEEPEYRDESIDDWEAALDYIIDASATSTQ